MRHRPSIRFLKVIARGLLGNRDEIAGQKEVDEKLVTFWDFGVKANIEKCCDKNVKSFRNILNSSPTLMWRLPRTPLRSLEARVFTIYTDVDDGFLEILLNWLTLMTTNWLIGHQKQILNIITNIIRASQTFQQYWKVTNWYIFQFYVILWWCLISNF